jgi:hypothetical protein
MSALAKLNFAPLPEKSVDPIVKLRDKVVSRLLEQRQLVEDPNHVRVTKKFRGKGDERHQVTQEQRVRPWFKDVAGGYALVVYVHGTPVEWSAGKNAILCKGKDELLAAIDSLLTAIRAGEVDRHLVKAPEAEAKAPKGKKAAKA